MKIADSTRDAGLTALVAAVLEFNFSHAYGAEIRDLTDNDAETLKSSKLNWAMTALYFVAGILVYHDLRRDNTKVISAGYGLLAVFTSLGAAIVGQLRGERPPSTSDAVLDDEDMDAIAQLGQYVYGFLERSGIGLITVDETQGQDVVDFQLWVFPDDEKADSNADADPAATKKFNLAPGEDDNGGF